MIDSKEESMLFNLKKKTPKKILVIDDDATTLEIIVQALSKAGYEVFLAQSGEKGLEIARNKSPDVMVIDVLMPGMDGFMLLKELKKDSATQKIPVLVLSARQNVADTIRRLGAVTFINKPVEPKQLLNQIKKLF